MTEKKWKDKLLSSSLPLEFEVSKCFLKHKFEINRDYTYRRLDETLEKEFSIDLLAERHFPHEYESPTKFIFKTLVECKYRNPSIKWLFINKSQTNNPEYEESLNRFYPGFLDQFSNKILSVNSASHLQLNDEFDKGVEVNLQTGDVHETGIFHGVKQLHYAFPVVLKEVVNSNLTWDFEETFPYALISILVTNAELRVVNEEFSTDLVQNSDRLEDFSIDVPYLIYINNTYPSFKRHVSNVFLNTPNIGDQVKLNKLLQKRVEFLEVDEKTYSSTDTDHFLNGIRIGYIDDSVQSDKVIICNINYLDQLLRDLILSVESVIETMQTIE